VSGFADKGKRAEMPSGEVSGFAEGGREGGGLRCGRRAGGAYKLNHRSPDTSPALPLPSIPIVRLLFSSTFFPIFSVPAERKARLDS